MTYLQQYPLFSREMNASVVNITTYTRDGQNIANNRQYWNKTVCVGCTERTLVMCIFRYSVVFKRCVLQTNTTQYREKTVCVGCTEITLVMCIFRYSVVFRSCVLQTNTTQYKKKTVCVGCTEITLVMCKSKAIPLQAWTGPEGSRRLRLPDFKTIGIWRW